VTDGYTKESRAVKPLNPAYFLYEVTESKRTLVWLPERKSVAKHTAWKLEEKQLKERQMGKESRGQSLSQQRVGEKQKMGFLVNQQHPPDEQSVNSKGSKK